MIAYLSQEELDAFAIGEVESLLGYAYEWEGEGVAHLHTRPLAHAFGKVSKCLFSKTGTDEVFLDGGFWHVFVGEGGPKVFVKVEKEFQSVDFQMIPSKENLYSRNKGQIFASAAAVPHEKS